jgi:hypothetical protein
MSGISPYADVKEGLDPFAFYRTKGNGFRLAGEGEGDETTGDLEDDVEGDGVSLAGEGFGRGTQKKVIRAVKKFAPKIGRAGLGLVSEFGSDRQKGVAAKALTAQRIVSGAGGCGGVMQQGKGVALRALVN